MIFAKSHIGKFISIVHTHGLVSKISYIKSVSTLHNYPFYDYMMRYGNIKGYVMATLHLKFISKINKPLACSKSVSNIFKIEKNISLGYIQNGTDTNRF